MSGFILLLWISVIVILNVRGEDTSMNETMTSDNEMKEHTATSTFETATQNIEEDTLKPLTTEKVIVTENSNKAISADATDQPLTEVPASTPIFPDLPQADQPMPDQQTDDEKPLLEVGNAIETSVVENSKPVEDERVQLASEMEPKGNSIENVATGMSMGNVMTCFGCVSTEEASCITKPTKEVACKTVDETPVGCFTLIKDSQIMRGCLEDLDVQQTVQCFDSKDKSCYICYGKNCNDVHWPQCYVCHSSLEHALCAWWSPQALLAQLTKLCPAFDDKCRVEISENGFTLRSCVAKTNECGIAKAESCRTCNMSLCNAGIFPMGRLHCHQCADATNCALAQVMNASLPCPVYSVEDSCFHYVDDVGSMQRGCKTSFEYFERCMAYGVGRCRTCNISNGCNSQALWLEPELSCSKCDTRKQNKPYSMGCAWVQTVESVTPCQNKHLYYMEESCEMIYQADIELAVRGCAHDIGPCESSYEACSECKTKACNSENFIWQYCVQCNSEELENSGNTAVRNVAEKCKLDMQSYEFRGCYTIVRRDTNITTRGCISDLSVEERNYCNANKKLCTFCYEQACNSLSALSSGNQVFMDNGVRLLLLGFIYSIL